MALTNISRIQSFDNYVITEEQIVKICGQKLQSMDINDIKFYGDVYSVDGSNKYVEVHIDDRWMLIDKTNNSIKEDMMYNPYYNLEDNFKVYNPSYIDFTFGFYDEGLFIDALDRDVINFDALASYTNTLSSKTGEYTRISEVGYQTNTKLIDNHFYFENLNHFHGRNMDNSCAVVASQILLGYYDTFINDNIVDEIYDISISEEKISCSQFVQSPGTGRDGSAEIGSVINNDFHDVLLNVADDIGIDTSNGFTGSERTKMIKTYLTDRNIDYDCNYVEGNAYDWVTDAAKSLIKTAINNNRPIVAGGDGHAVLVYGYDDNYVYAHTGWGYVGRTPWSTFEKSVEYTPTATDIIINDHVHSNNYYSTSLNKHLCGCTEISLNSSGTILLDKSDYTTYYRIKFTATSKMYVSLSTLIEEYDTRFLYITSTTTYTYNNDIDPEGEYSNYNACISVAEMDPGDTLEFTVDLSSVPIDTTLNSFTILLETEEV
ncbi:MAG: hypothetical protein IJA65_02925 [Acholeplasmatales bacterium]|nr:hypothetical protein [Acholeplasmatales bacterium]